MLVELLPPDREWIVNDADAVALNTYLEAVRLAQSMDHKAVRAAVAVEFETDYVVHRVLTALDAARYLVPDST